MNISESFELSRLGALLPAFNLAAAGMNAL